MVSPGPNSFWSFIGRKSIFFFWLPLGRLECYSIIIFFGFCIYSVYPRFLGSRCGCCDCFCTYDQSWSCILILFVNMDCVFWILRDYDIYIYIYIYIIISENHFLRWKKWPTHVDLGHLQKSIPIHIFLWAQNQRSGFGGPNQYPLLQLPKRPSWKKKRPRSTRLFINLGMFGRNNKNRACTKQS